MTLPQFTAQTLPIIKRARELIEEPAHWTKGWEAKDSRGEPVSPLGDAACSFCSIGALRRAAMELTPHGSDVEKQWIWAGYEVVRDLKTESLSLSGFNDDKYTTHQDVLAAFDKTIRRLS